LRIGWTSRAKSTRGADAAGTAPDCARTSPEAASSVAAPPITTDRFR
jgi:hypothetical protein